MIQYWSYTACLLIFPSLCIIAHRPCPLPGIQGCQTQGLKLGLHREWLNHQKNYHITCQDTELCYQWMKGYIRVYKPHSDIRKWASLYQTFMKTEINIHTCTCIHVHASRSTSNLHIICIYLQIHIVHWNNLWTCILVWYLVNMSKLTSTFQRHTQPSTRLLDVITAVVV